MRFGFVTCVELGLSCMEAIYEIGGTLDLAITLPDDQATRKSGRVYVDAFCAQNSIPLIKSRNVNDHVVIDAIRRSDIDWLFIIGWSQIAHEPLLAAPKKGALGMHPTLLPEGRGRAAIPWAILKGLKQTGVTLFKLDEGTDTGDIVDQLQIPLAPDTDASQLYATITAAHAELMRHAFPRLMEDAFVGRAQDQSKATVWPARTPEDGMIDQEGPVADAERLVRAVTRPYPGAYAIVRGRKIKVWKAEVLDDRLRSADGLVLQFSDGSLLCTDIEDLGPA